MRHQDNRQETKTVPEDGQQSIDLLIIRCEHYRPLLGFRQNVHRRWADRRSAGRRATAFRGAAATTRPQRSISCPWKPEAYLTADDGLVAPEFVWSARLVGIDLNTTMLAQHGIDRLKACAGAAV